MTITIDDRKQRRKVAFFSKFYLDLKYDSFGSVFSFDFYNNPKNPEHRLFAQMGQYQLARIEHNGELLLTGFILSQALNKAPADQITSFGGYAVPGVLDDSNIAMSTYPLQFDGLNLREIAQKVLKPFVIKMEIDPSVTSLMEEVYPTMDAEPTQTVSDFLVQAATQKNITISHTPNGRVLFTRSKTEGEPILHFEFGTIGTSMSISFNGQAMHSPITVVKQANKDGGNAGQVSINNPYVPKETTAFRPKTIIQNNGNDNDTMKVAMNALAVELKNIVLTISTDRWEKDGLIIKPNNIITALAPELQINRVTRWFVESISFIGDPEKTTAVLTCVLPEVYNGKIPKNIFF